MSDRKTPVYGVRIKILRGEKGWTQKELAHKAGISERLVVDFEKGLPQSITRTASVARALAVPYEAIAPKQTPEWFRLDKAASPKSPPVVSNQPPAQPEEARSNILGATPQHGSSSEPDADVQTIISLGERSFKAHAVYSTRASRASSGSDDPLQCDVDLIRLRAVGRSAFRRDRQLDRLDEAWRSHKCRVFSIVGPPGVGKSALTHQWLDRKEQEGYAGAAGVLGWSFSNPPFRVQTEIDDFLDRSIEWLGVTKSSDSAFSGMDRIRRVVSVLHRRHYLIVLDGVDALQPGVRPSDLVHPLLTSFLMEFASGEKGMCIVTTREPIPGFESAPRCQVIHLNTPSPEACTAVLAAGPMSGSPDDLIDLSTRVHGNGHALSLLAGYSSQKADKAAKNAAAYFGLNQEGGKKPQEILSALRDHLRSKPELVVLRTLSRFDGPADRAALIDASPSKETVQLSFTSTRRLHTRENIGEAVDRLLNLGLLVTAKPNMVDAHPFVRGFFRQDCEEYSAEDHVGICGRIYDMRAGGTSHFSNEQNQVTALRRALVYGCEANRHLECFESIYRKRRLHGRDQYVDWSLLYPESELSVLSSFFEEPWSTPLEILNVRCKAILLFQVAALHRIIGKPADAIPLFSKSLQYRVAEEDWAYAADIAVNLMEVHHMLGQFEEALNVARQGVDFANRCFAGRQQVRSRAALATALVHANRPDEALRLFDKPMTSLRWTIRDHLYTEARFDTLLALGRYDEVLEILDQLKWDGSEVSSHMSGIRRHAKARAFVGKDDPLSAAYALDLAIPGFRFAARKDKLPRVLILQAEIRNVGFYDKAEQELSEALRIAQETGHIVNEVVSEIALARFEAKTRRANSAASHHARALQLTRQLALNLWDQALEEVQNALGALTGHVKEAGRQAEEPTDLERGLS